MPEWLVTGAIGAVSSIVTILATGWILRQSNTPPEARPLSASGESAYVLRYPRVYAWLGVICILIGGSGIVIGAIWPPEAGMEWIWVAVLFVMFAVPGVMLLLSVRRSYVLILADGFTLHSWARREPAEVLWRDVERVAFSPTLGVFRFDTSDGRRVRVSAGLRGLPDLTGVIGALRARGAAEAAQQFRRYREGFGA